MSAYETAETLKIPGRIGFLPTRAHAYSTPSRVREFARAHLASDPLEATTAAPIARSIRDLMEGLLQKYLKPALSTKSAKEFREFIAEKCGEIIPALDAFDRLFREALPAMPVPEAHSLPDEMRRLAGEAGLSEYRFAEETMASAGRIATDLAKTPRDTMTEFARRRDERLAAKFNFYSGLHTFAWFCLTATAAEIALAESEAIYAAFEMYRWTALNAYLEARTGQALRAGSENSATASPGSLPLTREENALADASSRDLASLIRAAGATA